MTDIQTIAEVEKKLRYISSIIKQKGREILNHYPITPPQFIALQWLLDKGDLTIGELSQKMYLACSTTTDLVDRMEKSALLERVRDPRDRRVVRIHVLDKGKIIIQEVIEKRQKFLEEVLKGFDKEEVSMLSHLLNHMHKDMVAYYESEKNETS